MRLSGPGERRPGAHPRGGCCFSFICVMSGRYCRRSVDRYFVMNSKALVAPLNMLIACMGERRDAYRVSVGRPETRRPIRRSGRRWEDNI